MNIKEQSKHSRFESKRFSNTLHENEKVAVLG